MRRLTGRRWCFLGRFARHGQSKPEQSGSRLVRLAGTDPFVAELAV